MLHKCLGFRVTPDLYESEWKQSGSEWDEILHKASSKKKKKEKKGVSIQHFMYYESEGLD